MLFLTQTKANQSKKYVHTNRVLYMCLYAHTLLNILYRSTFWKHEEMHAGGTKNTALFPLDARRAKHTQPHCHHSPQHTQSCLLVRNRTTAAQRQRLNHEHLEGIKRGQKLQCEHLPELEELPYLQHTPSCKYTKISCNIHNVSIWYVEILILLGQGF